MSSIKLVNQTELPAMIYMSQGSTLSGRLPVGAGGSVIVPTTNSYIISGTITMDDGNTYVSAPVSFTSPSQSVLAQVHHNDGTYTFQLVASSGTAPSQITLSNSCKYPVQFSIVRNGSPLASVIGSPLASVIVVNEFDTEFVSTAQTYTFSGDVDGIMTDQITSSDPDIVVALVADNNPVADFQGYSLTFL